MRMGVDYLNALVPGNSLWRGRSTGMSAIRSASSDGQIFRHAERASAMRNGIVCNVRDFATRGSSVATLGTSPTDIAIGIVPPPPASVPFEYILNVENASSVTATNVVLEAHLLPHSI